MQQHKHDDPRSRTTSRNGALAVPVPSKTTIFLPKDMSSSVELHRQTKTQIGCSECGTKNPAGKKFCGGCGSQLSARCPKCGAETSLGFKFCGDCGVSLFERGSPANEEGPDRVTANPSESPESERKTVTALFADIKGSTELMRDLDPEEALTIVDPVLHQMIAAVRRYDGYVAQSTGDGIFALFGAPMAHEDHPQRALHAALAMQQDLRQYTEKLKRENRRPVEVRIGVNTGEVVVRTIDTGEHKEYTPVGHPTNLASRMQATAPAGSIVISDDTRRLVEHYFELRPLGPTIVKGVDVPINVHEVLGARPLRGHFEAAARRGLTKFVGRERELAELERALELALSGHGQVAAIVGEAGTGKSRLVHEFKAQQVSACRVLEGRPVSHGRAAAWLPTLDLLHGYFGISGADDPLTRRGKLNSKLVALDPALGDTLPYLFALLGIPDEPDPLAQMDGRVKKLRTLEAIKRVLLRESLSQPLLLIFEDLHWIDSETQALLDLLAESIASTRVLLLVNYRPEYRHEWSGRGHYLQLRLDPLGYEHAAAMLAALLGEGAELEALRRLVAQRTGGNPFFIEEMVHALFEQRILAFNGTARLQRPLSQAHLPVTVQGMVASRIDRLPASDKELLQTLAVLGQVFPLGLVRCTVQKAGDELERALGRLQLDEFIYEQPAPDDIKYHFKHSLTHEVAYNSLLMERRKVLHERAGEALESMFTGQLDDHLGELAHHYSRSDNVAKALEYLGRAGRQGLQRYAYAEAANGLTAAIELLKSLPESPALLERELLLQLAVGSALSAINGWGAPEVERAYARARELCGRVGHPPELFPTLCGLWSFSSVRGELRTALKLGDEMLRRARRARDASLFLYAQRARGENSFYMGEFLLARKHLKAAMSQYDSERHRSLGSRGGGVDPELAYLWCLGHTSWILWYLGYPDQALRTSHEALELARELSHPLGLAISEFSVSTVHQLRGNMLAAKESAERIIALSVQHGFTEILAFSTVLRGRTIAKQQPDEEAVAQIREGLAGLRLTGSELGRPYFLALSAEACAEIGRLDEGLNAVTEALATTDQHEIRHHEAELHRLRGELVLRQNSNLAEARSCFQHAIAIARNQHAKSLELRATMSLARLLAKQGYHNEGSTMLADIYGWFSEGSDTADLKDAKALLDELRAAAPRQLSR